MVKKNYVSHNNQNFIINTVGIHSLLKSLHPDLEMSVENIDLLVSNESDIFLISGNYLINDRNISFSIPIQKNSKNFNSKNIFKLLGCTMTCEPINCSNCQQTIVTPCESFTCECLSNEHGSQCNKLKIIHDI